MRVAELLDILRIGPLRFEQLMSLLVASLHLTVADH
jgi:hypothetical protein